MTSITRSLSFASALVLPLVLLACGGDDDGFDNDEGVCSPAAQTGCAPGLACEEVEGGEPACFAPLTVQGRVFDLTDAGAKPVAGARVVARNANEAVVSPVAVSGPDGAYSLRVPARRGSDGRVLKTDVTLRADAQGYQTFPLPPRIAIPIDLATAAGDPPVVKNAATDVGLLAIANAASLGWVSGKVLADLPGGTLVTAGGSTGVADSNGDYVVYNVQPGGAVAVKGYLQGTNLEARTASVAAGAETGGVDLASLGPATAVVSGSVQIVNAPGGSVTTVILAVEETFKENVARGEAPQGLRAAGVTGAFEIANVPDGNYVVLAAFENDDLVRDPDTGIGGTDIVHITVSGQSVSLAEGFKVTEALDVVSPGANSIEEVSGTPTFVWQADTSESGYQLFVFDALGNEVWKKLDVPEEKDKTVSQAYGGPALQPGMIYQFRAVSLGKDGIPISSTEDLRGVFQYR